MCVNAWYRLFPKQIMYSYITNLNAYFIDYHNWEAAPRDTNLQGGDIFVVNICVDIYSYKNCILQQTHTSFYLNIWKRFAVTNDNEVHISSARKK